MQEKLHVKPIVRNKKASFNYFLSEPLECGIELKGTEIKSLRQNKASIDDAYIVIKNGQAFIINMNISLYDKGNIFNHDPLRDRKLLMHKKEILKYEQKTIKQGYTIIPTKLYFKGGKAKLEIALGKGKKLYDKREDLKQKSIKKDIELKLKQY